MFSGKDEKSRFTDIILNEQTGIQANAILFLLTLRRGFA